MKKLLLVSMMHNVTDVLKKAEPHLAGKTAVYIPTAVIPEVDEIENAVREMADEETKMLESMGLKVDELEVSTAPYEKISDSLHKSDIIFVGGGNTFFLLQELKRTGADQILIREVENGKMYIGESAGAVAACPDIGYCTEMDSPDKAPDLTDYSGLGLVDFYVVPHLGNQVLGAGAEKIIEKYSNELDLKIITDEQAILVEGDRTAVIN